MRRNVRESQGIQIELTGGNPDHVCINQKESNRLEQASTFSDFSSAEKYFTKYASCSSVSRYTLKIKKILADFPFQI